MARKGLAGPLLTLIVGLTFILTTLARTESGSAPSRMQGTGYPPQTSPTQANSAAYPSPGAAGTPATAVAQTITATTPLTTTTPAATLSPTTGAARTPTLAAQVQATMPPQPTLTATLVLTGDVACASGQQLTISGVGPPRAPILLYFGQRIVGGGSVGRDGTFSLPLLVGAERGGDYPVAVRVRGSGQVLTEFTCAVPAATPTPLPVRRPIP